MRPSARVVFAIVVAAAAASACVDEPDQRRDEAELLGLRLPILNGADQVGGLRWNRIAWNRIAWNRIAWNRIAWNSLTLEEAAWQDLRVHGLTQASLPAAGADPRAQVALSDPDIRELFGFIAECALTPGDSFSITDAGGVSSSYHGLHAMAPQWKTGACDEGCQRSVSACLLARVNYFGERNVLSWRRATGLPYNSTTAGMEAPSQAERSSFDLDEGAAWGNLFVEEPEIAVCSGADGLVEVSLLNTISLGVYTGQVPVSALRMCNGDVDCLDEVYAGPCAGAGAVCTTQRPNGAYQGCARPGAAERYDEVVTIRRADFAIHADFVAGHPIDPAMSSCADEVQDALPACADAHDAACVDRALADCALHDVRSTGLALGRHASTCSAYVCAIDSLCCTLLWDSVCVTEARSLCR